VAAGLAPSCDATRSRCSSAACSCSSSSCACWPRCYSHDIAHIGPDTENITGTIKVGGKTKDIVSLIGIPIGRHGPAITCLGRTWRDGTWRCVLLYGGRNSLEIGMVATLLTMLFGTMAGLLAGYFRGITDGVISRILDVIWAYPAVLLGSRSARCWRSAESGR